MKTISKLFHLAYLLLFLLINTSFSLEFNSTKCIQNSFNVALNDTEVVKKSVKLTFSINVNIQIENEQEYISKCFKSILITYKASNSTKNESNEIKVGNKTTQVILLSHLSYLTTYEFNVRYKQYVNEEESLNATEVIVDIDDLMKVNINTCFSEPEHPKLSLPVIEKDGSIYYEWERSLANDAPYVCYYNLTIADFTHNNLKTLITNETSYRTKPSDDLHFYISAVNSAECFIKDYSFANECKISKLQSNIYVSSVKKGNKPTWWIVSSVNFESLIYSLSTTTQTATTIKNNSNNIFGSYLCMIICLILSEFVIGKV
jgi:hypothetical protein